MNETLIAIKNLYSTDLREANVKLSDCNFSKGTGPNFAVGINPLFHPFSFSSHFPIPKTTSCGTIEVARYTDNAI